MPIEKTVKDRAFQYNLALTVLAVLTAVVALFTNLTSGGWEFGLRIATVALAVATAVTGLFKFGNERAYKTQQEGEKATLEQALRAESRRTSLLINGAMLGTADKLRRFAALDAAGRDREISGFRSAIVSKVCDLMQSDAPRAAYFRVQRHADGSRVMTCGSYMDSINREDSFTSQFVEGVGTDQGVWALVDSGDVESSNDIDVDVPPTWDTGRGRIYKSFVSVAVRADTVAFGMLTANTLEKDGFTPSDIASIKILAHLLAAAEATART
ncbi:hypothetical protein [Mycolicibacterium bacteremicum]|uniref:GAF domain-containing protein n=1 Tax=Mycolicibacterium bacteremicum TaxID=564198 RepID=A0A1W9YNI4_MYCBA|nr:hypothetical protein [Mycolicibacterium bacteremicum]MCV7434232.1 hypothetical protein [Mycolicibacterium bacteremicum]ORA01594.1 hypothetical protein BST17_27455 [Mycolicibacterium bacteremicum]